MLLVDQRLPQTQAAPGLDARDEGTSLTPWARGIYQLIFRRGRVSYDDLPMLFDTPSAQLRPSIEELVSLGLIHVDGCWLTAVPYHQAVDALLAEQNRIIRVALTDISALQRRLTTLAEERAWLGGDSVGTVVDASAGQGDSEQHVSQVRPRPNVSLTAMHPGARFSQELLDNSLRRAQADIARGVRLRVVHQSAALSHPRSADYLHKIQQMGGQVRLRNDLPFRLIIVDGDSAVCCLEWQEGLRETLLLQGAYIIGLLGRLFETIWMDSVPLGAAFDVESTDVDVTDGYHAPTLTGQQAAIMRRLAEGATDRAIANSLGITTRTVTRRIGEIYEALGAQSRFQAGATAQRIGLI